MSEIILQVRNVSKWYRLGSLGTRSFRQDIQRWWTTTVQRKNPSFFGPPPLYNQAKNRVMALGDVSFDIKRGEVWGLVGANGSGKSTLLKIISRVIRPSEGMVRGKGKISSLLEAGTGFHQELSGRENIYVSGFMLGMRRREIQQKLDEIIDFSGVDKFIDTPIKHYSSGMYMRLAFAVAAYLEPDILIMDEILAVGDANFQKKSLDKMREVARDQGRTILFVSHNVQAINQLCRKSLWLQQGKIKEIGDTHLVINRYTSGFRHNNRCRFWNDPNDAPGNTVVRIKAIEVLQEITGDQTAVDIRTPFCIRVSIWTLTRIDQLSLSLQLYTCQGECVCELTSLSLTCDASLLEGKYYIPGNFLNDGTYTLSLQIVEKASTVLYDYSECLSFLVEDQHDFSKAGRRRPGIVCPSFPFTWMVLA